MREVSRPQPSHALRHYLGHSNAGETGIAGALPALAGLLLNPPLRFTHGERNAPHVIELLGVDRSRDAHCSTFANEPLRSGLWSSRGCIRQLSAKLSSATINGRWARSGLPEPQPLDAAHIVPNEDEQFGQPVVPIGIPLSKKPAPRRSSPLMI